MLPAIPVKPFMSDTDTEAAATEFPTVEELGAWLPQYEVLERIHCGRESAIYFARQPALDRHVMIRVLAEPPLSAAAALMERLRSRARLVHPRVVALFDFGRTAGGPLYLVTEHVDGALLQTLIQERQITPRHAYALALQICETLQIIHDQHIAHGALSVRTILVTRDWQVKATGIGMAELEDGELSWLAERQASVEADLRALGALLHELFGKEPPPPDGRVSRDLPPAFALVVRRCLHLDVTRRYTSAQEVREALVAALKSEQAASTARVNPTGLAASAPAAPKPRTAAPAPGAPTPGVPYRPPAPIPVSRPGPSLAKRIDDFLWTVLRFSLHGLILAVSIGAFVLLILFKDKIVISTPEESSASPAGGTSSTPAPEPPSGVPMFQSEANPPAPVLPAPPVQAVSGPISLPAGIASKPMTPPAPDPLVELDAQYLKAVQKEAELALEQVRLNDMPYIRQELQRLQTGMPVPPVDEPGLPAGLKRLREVYRQQRQSLGR